MLGSLIETDIELNTITTKAVYDDPFYGVDFCLEFVSEGEENIPLDKNFITSPADTDIHIRVKLQDA